MNETPTFQRLTIEALEEHRQIHFYMDQLVRTLQDLADPSEDVEPMRRLGAELGSLIDRLTEHFQTEEKGGIYQGALEVLPDRRSDLRRLSDQHTRMLEILEMARIHAQRAAASDAGALKSDLEGFLETLRKHESVEEEILTEALKVGGRIER